MLLRSEGPLAVDFFHVLRNLNWATKFLQNCTTKRINYISNSLGNLLNSASVSFDEIFTDVNVAEYIKNEEALYLYQNENEFLKSKSTNELRQKNGIKIKKLSKNEILDLEPSLAPVFYNGQIFIGSRHTTNPSMISKKIFETFINNGGGFIQSQVDDIVGEEDFINLNFNNNNYKFEKAIICAGAWSNNLSKKLVKIFL
jgi:D-amino-acid dehydrogenase